ncbi:MAG: biopolymer transporter ExbD [Lentilitoribacter sp.]
MHIPSQTTHRKKLSLTSLIDVIFLLLLFFMLSSTFSKYSKLEISASAQGSITATQQRTSLIALDGELIRLNGQGASRADLVALLAQVNDEKNIAVITTSAQTSTQQLVDVLSTLSEVDGLAITIAR